MNIRKSCSSMLLEVLYLALMLLCFRKRVEGAKVASLSCGFTLLLRVEAVFSGLEFTNHSWMDARRRFICRLEDFNAVTDRMLRTTDLSSCPYAALRRTERLRAAFLAACCKPECPLVRTAFAAARCRADVPRLREAERDRFDRDR